MFYIIKKLKRLPLTSSVRSSRFAMYYPVVKCYTKRRAIDVAPRGDMRLAHLLVDFRIYLLNPPRKEVSAMTVFEALMIALTSCTLVVLLITCIVMIIALIK